MSDLHVVFNEGYSRRVKCRYHWLDNCKNSNEDGYLKKNTPYIVIRGWCANGQTNLVICHDCAKKFFDQIDDVKKQMTIPQKASVHNAC